MIIWHINQGRKKFTAGLAGILFGLSLLITPAVSALSVGGPSDCDDNAIIRCGAHSTGELMNAYQSTPYVKAVYSYFGISQTDMANLQVTNVAGRVTKDGKVYVDNQSQPVATNATTVGRTGDPSDQIKSQGAVFYVRHPNNNASFQQDSLPAFVSMKNGQFQFAVIASCGNAVKATPASNNNGGQGAVGQGRAVSAPRQRQVQTKAAPAQVQTQSQAQAQSQSQSVNIDNSDSSDRSVTNNNNNSQPNTSTQTPAAQPTTQSAPQATTVTSQPASLVNTGPTGVIGLFLASSMIGAYAFRRYLNHQLNA